jgi:hypothetical protein
MSPCRYRGELLRVERGTEPGCRARAKQPTEVFRCRIHAVCTYRPYKAGQGERVCLRCEDSEKSFVDIGERLG